VREVKSSNPGYCYMCAGWEKGETKRGKLFLYAPAERCIVLAEPEPLLVVENSR